MQLNRPAVTLRILALLCVAAAAALLPVPAAHAQGTSGMLPDPISTSELDRYAQFLGLSSEQRQAIDPMHSRYLEQFSQLRSDEIDDFLEESRGLRRNLFSNADGGEAVRKITRDHNRIMSRISSLDSQLFNQIQTVLSEDQVVDLSRARLARERQRYSTNATRFATAANPAVRVDLTEMIYEDVELSAADMQTVDAPLRRYEAQLTDALESLYGKATGMFERIVESVNETVGEVDREDPQQMQAMFRAIRDAWQQANVEVTEEAQKVASLNRRSFEVLNPLLSDDGRRALQRRFYREAYGTAFRNSGEADRRFDAALGLDDLSDETRSAINSLRTSYESRFTALASQLMDAVDERRADRSERGFGFRRNDDDDNSPSREKLNNLRDRLTQLEDDTLEQLHALLGEERVAAIEGANASEKAQTASGQVTLMTADGGTGVATFSGTFEVETTGAAADPYVAQPISQTDLDFYVQTLEVDDQLQAIIDSIYAEYRESYQRISEQYLEPLAKMSRQSWGFRRGRGGRDDVDPPTADDVNRIYSMRREAMNEILSIDDQFFTDVGLLFNDNDTTQARMRRIRQSRLRDVYNRGETGGGAMFVGGGGAGRFRMNTGGEEERVDLTRALREIEFDNDHQPSVESVLNTYSDAMTASLRQQYETSLAFAEAMQLAVVEMMNAERAAQDDDDDDRDRRRFRMGGRMREINEELGEQRQAVTQQIIQLNRQTVDELRNLLPEALATEVRDAYYTEAFPGVYRDRNAAGRVLDASLELPDLTADQRSKLLDIAAEYRGAYDELNIEMVRVQMTQPAGDDDSEGRDRRGRNWQRMQEVRNEIDRLRFARDELNEKTRRRIKAVLNDRQVGQVRGLEAAED